MDPNATLKLLLDSYFDQDFETMNEAAELLADWIRAGGFPPDFSQGPARDATVVLADCAKAKYLLWLASQPKTWD